MKKVFTVFDSKAEAHLDPFYAPTTAVGARQFEAAANSVEHVFYRFAGDFTLFEIAEWDEDKGQFVMYAAAKNLGTALSYQKER